MGNQLANIINIGQDVIGGESIQTVNARQLHTGLGVKKDFSDWIKAQILRARLVEKRDYLASPLKGVGGKFDSIEYHLTIESAKHIAMMSGTEKGFGVREYFLECERLAKQKTQALPVVKSQAMQLIIAQAMAFDRLEQEQQRQATEIAKLGESLAVIEARTQPENKHFTVMGFANLVGKSIDIKEASNLGRKCAKLSRSQGLTIGDIKDPRFGIIHSYHESVLESVFEIEGASV